MAVKEKTVIHPRYNYEMPFKFNFLTLTVYSTDRNITGKEAHKTCLEPLLRWLRQTQGVKMYIWKAELQKRGQIHYHITTDNFVYHKDLQNKWNELQRSAGYLDTFYKKFGRWNAPSCQAAGVKKARNVASYLIKEFGKSMQNGAPLGGKVWDCSMNLKASNYFTTNNDYYGELSQAVDRGEIGVVYTDNATIFKMFNEPAYKFLRATDFLDYNNLMDNIALKELQRIKKAPPGEQSFNYLSDKPPSFTIRKVDFLPLPDLFSTS